MKKMGLGRGLDALLPEADWQSSVRDIPITEIDINPDQPRKAFDEDALNELAASIREVGLLQPILVQPVKGRYQIIAGERRFRASRIAGLTHLPCIEKDFSDEERQLATLIENLQREDLNPMEEAAAIRGIMDSLKLTQEEAAQRIGRSRPALANSLRLLTLPENVADLVREGQLSEGHARALVSVKDKDKQLRLAERVIREGLSVRQLEELLRAPAKPAAARPAVLAPELMDFAERVRRATGLRTHITGTMKKGKLVINYSSYEELESLYALLQQVME